MAIKDIIDTAVDVGKTVVTRGRQEAERRLRGGKEETPSPAAAPKPGEAGGPKSATAPTRPKKAKPKKAKAKPAKKRSTATRAAATSADEVKGAAEK